MTQAGPGRRGLTWAASLCSCSLNGRGRRWPGARCHCRAGPDRVRCCVHDRPRGRGRPDRLRGHRRSRLARAPSAPGAARAGDLRPARTATRLRAAAARRRRAPPGRVRLPSQPSSSSGSSTWLLTWATHPPTTGTDARTAAAASNCTGPACEARRSVSPDRFTPGSATASDPAAPEAAPAPPGGAAFAYPDASRLPACPMPGASPLASGHMYAVKRLSTPAGLGRGQAAAT